MREYVLREIRELPWYSDQNLYAQFLRLSSICEWNELSFWGLVEEVGGLFALQVLIHAILTIRGIVQHAPRGMGAAADPG